MWFFLLTSVLFMVVEPAVPAERAVRETSALRLALLDDGGLEILQKQTGVRWSSRRPDGVDLTLVEVRDAAPLAWTVRFDAKDWQVSAAVSDNECLVTVEGPEDRPMGNSLPYPFAFMPPDGTYEAVVPMKEGLLLNVADAAIPKVSGWYGTYEGSGLSMPWFGMTNLRDGMAVLFETPDDCGLDLRAGSIDGAPVWRPQPVWLPSRRQARYPRRMRYRFFDTGGYVAMAKWYRRRLMAEEQFRTLRDKARETPALAKLIGAMDVHLMSRRENAQEAFDVIQWFHGRGVTKMLVNTRLDRRYTDQFKDWGYLLGVYEIYTDMHAPDSLGHWRRNDEKYSRGFPDDAYMQPDGQMVHGFGWRRGSGATYRCSARQLPLMQELVPPLVAEHRYEALFLDVVTAGQLRECWSYYHPLTRSRDKEEKIALLQYAAGLGLVTGSEDGQSWAVPCLHYFEGLVMTRRFGYMPGIFINNFDREFKLNEEYKQFDLNEQRRIPLWELVYHDAVVATWRWNFTPDRYSDRTWWDKHDLINIMTGTMPIFAVSKATLQTRGDRMVQSYENVSRLNETTGWEEMTDHRFLTPDRRVHEVRYADGTVVTINFSMDTPYRPSGRPGIPPLGYAVSRAE